VKAAHAGARAVMSKDLGCKVVLNGAKGSSQFEAVVFKKQKIGPVKLAIGKRPADEETAISRHEKIRRVWLAANKAQNNDPATWSANGGWHTDFTKGQLQQIANGEVPVSES